MRVAIYPGSFDPITLGHIDIIKKGLKIFDKVIVLVANNDAKQSRFSINERYLMVKEAVKELERVEVDLTEGLTVEYARKVGTHYLIRGIRDDKDMAYEMNYANLIHQLDKEIQFTYIKASKKYSMVSSTLVHEMAIRKNDISQFAPESVIKMYEKR